MSTIFQVLWNTWCFISIILSFSINLQSNLPSNTVAVFEQMLLRGTLIFAYAAEIGILEEISCTLDSFLKLFPRFRYIVSIVVSIPVAFIYLRILVGKQLFNLMRCIIFHICSLFGHISYFYYIWSTGIEMLCLSTEYWLFHEICSLFQTC